MSDINRTFRHELKYYINYFDYEILRRRIEMILSRDRHTGTNKDYHVRSLYFDDLSNTALFEKQSGILERKKYRIRIYNLSDSVIKLEKKSRIGAFINKSSAPLTREQYDLISTRNFSFLREGKNSLFNEIYFDFISSHYKPTVIVDYIREPFVYDINNIRITFDKSLRTGLYNTNIFSKDNMTIDVLEEPKLIMEVKYDHFLPDFIRNLIQPKASQRYAVSKYVICRKYTKNNSWEDN
jgi:hypothetical protein